MPSPKHRHLPPEKETGDYYFDGTIVATNGINEAIPVDQITAIVLYTRALAEKNQGIDYFQVFQDVESGQKIYFIDQLTREALKSGRYEEKDNHATLLYPHEY